MRIFRRRLGGSPFRRLQPPLPIRALYGLVMLAALFAGMGAAMAESVRVSGMQDRGFGRIQLNFDTEAEITARAANGVLVISFDRSLRIEAERLAREMPSYVTVVRVDPDGTGMRLALTQNFSANVLRAGEIAFVDLLPERWTGMPPGMPHSVIEDLARRAREAERRFADDLERRLAEVPRDMPVRVAELPTLTRLIFDPPVFTPLRRRVEDDFVELRFSEPFRLAPERPLAGIPGLRAVEDELADGELVVRLQLEPGFEARGFHEESSYIVDIEAFGFEIPEPDMIARTPASRPGDPLAPPLIAADNWREGDPPPESGETGPVAVAADESRGRERDDTQAIPELVVTERDLIREMIVPDRERSDRAAEARGRFDAHGESLRLHFDFGDVVPAAAFERAGILRVVFHSQTPLVLDPQPLGTEALARLDGVAREGPFVTVRFALERPVLSRLVPERDGWVLSIGEAVAAAAPEPIVASRDIDEAGRHVVLLDLAEASGVHWIDAPETGERIAIVTAPGRARNIAKSQRFVEFALLPSAHGAVISAIADDVRVRPYDDHVAIGRPRDLVISGVGISGEGGTAQVGDELVFAAAPWREAQGGSVRRHLHKQIEAVTQVQPSQRGQARMDVARFMLANQLVPEALGVLRVVAQDEPEERMGTRWLLLKAAGQIAMGRLGEARGTLLDPEFDNDAEVLLWRAYLDALEGRTQQAIAGFRRGRSVLEAYSDDLQGRMRLALAQVALEAGEIDLARREAAAMAQLNPDAVSRDALSLLLARIDLAIGRPEAALAVFDRLAENASRPYAARAELLRLEHGVARGNVAAEDAIEAAERLVVSWRGDDVEVRTLGLLGRLYAQEGRWRDAFLAARNANFFFPNHPVARDLHDETARIFDEIFIGGRDEGLDEVQAVALFFDFREFLPIGRRGDEIVRHLADRLVELDLLDKAAELLRHQVENRLSGSARATVAARLATLYLMEGEPLAAREVLAETRLPELPESIRRARLLLEARALSDLSRTDLALEVLAEEEGADVDRLRADILWSARRWREAGEAHEAMTGTRWQDGDELTRRERTDILRAAIAYSLGDEPLALDRLRAKYLDQMSQSEDAQVFAIASAPEIASSEAFREVAARVTSMDTLFDFLEEYQKRHPETALPLRRRGRSSDGVPETLEGEQAARGVLAGRSG
ncbi:MAG: tetratricopeptide repeat protein [Salinarimonas sp.]